MKISLCVQQCTTTELAELLAALCREAPPSLRQERGVAVHNDLVECVQAVSHGLDPSVIHRALGQILRPPRPR